MLQDVKPKVPGNDQVILGLERLLERARLGALRAAAVIFAEHTSVESVYIGDENTRMSICFGLDMFKHAIMNDVTRVNSSRTPPPANRVVYDLNMDPISFDFIPWLATQEMARRREKAAAPLRVAFVANPKAIVQRVELGAPAFDNIVRPALSLFGAVEGDHGPEGRHPGFAGMRDIGRGYDQGEEVPQLTIPEEAASEMRRRLQGRQPVTFTFRETQPHEYRNSNLEEWHKLAMWLCHQGEDVIIVRDTAKARESFPGFETCPEASINLHTRAALYSQAKCNMFVQNGPFVLAPYTRVPWLLFARVGPDEPEEYNRPENWAMANPINDEGQLLWATPNQRIVYGPDTFPVMQAAYEALHL